MAEPSGIAGRVPDRDLRIVRILRARIEASGERDLAARQAVYAQALAALERRIARQRANRVAGDPAAERRAIENAILLVERHFRSRDDRKPPPQAVATAPETTVPDPAHRHRPVAAALIVGAIASLLLTTPKLPPGLLRDDEPSSDGGPQRTAEASDEGERLGWDGRPAIDAASGVFAPAAGGGGSASETDPHGDGQDRPDGPGFPPAGSDPPPAAKAPRLDRPEAERSASGTRPAEARRSPPSALPGGEPPIPEAREAEDGPLSALFDRRFIGGVSPLVPLSPAPRAVAAADQPIEPAPALPPPATRTAVIADEPAEPPPPVPLSPAPRAVVATADQPAERWPIRLSPAPRAAVAAADQPAEWPPVPLSPAPRAAAIAARPAEPPPEPARGTPWDHPAAVALDEGRAPKAEPLKNVDREAVGSIDQKPEPRQWTPLTAGWSDSMGSASRPSMPPATWFPGGAPSDVRSPENGEGAPPGPLPDFAGTIVVTASEAKVDAVGWQEILQQFPGKKAPQKIVQADVRLDRRRVATMFLRRNEDSIVPASHIIELVFERGAAIAGSKVVSIGPASLRDWPDAKGEELVAFPFQIAPGRFVMTLSPNAESERRNMLILLDRPWISFPLGLANGGSCVLVLQKGRTGDEVFRAVLATPPGGRDQAQSSN